MDTMERPNREAGSVLGLIFVGGHLKYLLVAELSRRFSERVLGSGLQTVKPFAD